jgi:excinuclease ABC subunit C
LYRARSACDETESLELFITSYYDPGRPPPGKIFLQPAAWPDSRPATDSDSTPDINIHSAAPKLDSWFKDQFGFIPEMIVSGETHHAAILAMARQNASEDLRKRIKDRGAGPALDELAQVLNLETRPQIIEGFDIAQLDGKHPVASLISFKNGIPNRKNYRYFKLRSVIGVVDDYASMREAVRRRYTRQIREGGELPDLILIDGGIGQVNTAKAVIDELGMHCGIVGLAKREEELWLPDAREPIVLSRRSEALKVLQHVRDECHRFATTLNQKLRSKDLFFPVLESVDGIGPARAAAIMKVYENIDNIAAADPMEIAGRCGINEASARAVRAVAKNAVEDREDSIKRLNTGRHNTESGQFIYGRRSYTMRLAEEAAEDEGEYDAGLSRESGD